MTRRLFTLKDILALLELVFQSSFIALGLQCFTLCFMAASWVHTKARVSCLDQSSFTALELQRLIPCCMAASWVHTNTRASCLGPLPFPRSAADEETNTWRTQMPASLREHDLRHSLHAMRLPCRRPNVALACWPGASSGQPGPGSGPLGCYYYEAQEGWSHAPSNSSQQILSTMYGLQSKTNYILAMI